jgi:Immunoglobulin domain
VLAEPSEPKFEAEPRGQIVAEGEEAVLECAANSFPEPQITWLKDQTLLDTK